MTQSQNKKPDAIAELKRVVEQMSPEDRTRLQQAGMVVPHGDISQLASGDFTWGLRCTHCNQIALYFVGDTWDLGHGNVYDEPPAIPQRQLLWTQMLPPEKIDRNVPRCQHCAVTLPLEANGAFSYKRQRLVRVAEWQKSRDRSFERRFVRETVKTLTAETGQYSAEVSSTYDLASASGPVSKIIESQQGPGSLEKLDQIAQASGVTKALARGFK